MMPDGRNRRHLPVLCAYLAAAVLMTWPLVLHITTAYPSGDAWYGGDPNMYIWWMDWLAEAFAGSTPVEAGRMLYFPQGINPWAGYDGILMAVIGVPAVLASGNPVLGYNLIILTAFVTAAGAAYALLFTLTRSVYASAIGGFMYGFSTYLLVRALQHPNLSLIAVIPLLVLAAWKFGEEPRPKRLAWLAGAVFLNGLTSSYYHVGGLIFVALILAYRWRRWWPKKRLALAAVAAVIIAAALPAAPMLFFRSGSLRPYSAAFVSGLGVQPLNFILPHPLTNVFGPLTDDVFVGFPTVFWDGPNVFETTSYFGIVVLTALLTLALFRKRIEAPAAGFWGVTIAVFSVLAMGIDLRLGGWRLPLPLAALRHLFPFSLVRSPNRLFIFALLAAIVLTAYVLRHLRRNLKGGFQPAAITAVILIVIAAETAIFPYPLVVNRVPEFYRQLAERPDALAIADLPITYPGISEYNYFQTVHGKPIVDGEFFYPSYSPQTFAFIESNALLEAAVCRQDRPEEITLPDRAAIMAELRAAGVHFVVVHNILLHNTPHCGYSRRFIREFFAGVKPYFTDGEITVYYLPPDTTLQLG